MIRFSRLFLFCAIIFLPVYLLETFAQSTDNDLDLIIEKEIVSIDEHIHDISFGISKKKSFLARYNPVTLSLSCLMFSYQKWLSPQISSNCYYEPSCSRYSKLLFQEFGLVKGLFSSIDRLMRCDRISATTFHPVSIDPVDNKIHESIYRYKLKTDLPQGK